MPQAVADRRRVERILRDPYAGSKTEYSLRIGGKDYRLLDRVRSATREENDDQGIGISLQVTVAGHLPPEMARKRVELDLIYGEERVRRFTGRSLAPRPEGVNTVVTAYTGGFWLDKIKLNKYREFSGQTPYDVSYEMLNRMPYDKEFIEVPEVLTPAFYRRARRQVLNSQNQLVDVATGDQGYPPWTACGQPLVDVAGQANLSFRDNALNGCTGYLKRVRTPKPVWHFELRGSELELSEPKDLETGPWYDVVIFRQKPDSIEPDILAGPEVVPDSEAPVDATLWLETSDQTPAATTNAIQALTDTLDGLTGVRRRGAWSRKLIHPYLTRGTAISILQEDEDDDGAVERRWEGTLVGVTDNYDNETQSYIADLRLVNVTRPEPPPIPLPGPSGYSVSPLIWTASSGVSYLDPDFAWVTVQPDGTLALNTDAAASEGVLITEDAPTSTATINPYGLS